MEIFVITPFPEVIKAVVDASILGRATKKGIVHYHIINLREYAEGRYQQIDDYPFGGGTGMVMMARPIFKAVDEAVDRMGKLKKRIIYTSPQGKILDQNSAWELSKEEGLVFICGHYKGIDERIRKKLVTDEISIGDYVLTGGELPALIMIDSIVRLIPGVLGDFDSATTDSFTHHLLDYPHYTRPKRFGGMKVPDVLLSGHHAKIKAWRQKQREKRTKERRPDLWNIYLEETSKKGVGNG